MRLCSRRTLLKFASALLPLQAAQVWGASALLESGNTADAIPRAPQPLDDIFPAQPRELVREMVTVSHFDFKRVRELVDARPSLARAAWDWGFGDWESGLGAASHMGNRPIAEYLISQGARPSLFSATMLGQLDVVKAFIVAQPGAQRIRGPHSISLLAHAKAGGDAARPVLEYLQSLGDADSDPPVPLSDAEIAGIVGSYVFGMGANQRVEITADKGQLTWTRPGMFFGRGMVHLGQRTFYPIGAQAVRISFADYNGGMVMKIYDPDLVLTAEKKK